MKDISVAEEEKKKKETPPEPPRVPDDPAIMSVSLPRFVPHDPPSPVHQVVPSDGFGQLIR